MKRYPKKYWRILLSVTLCAALLLSNPSNMWMVNSYASLENDINDEVVFAAMYDSSIFIDQELSVIEEAIDNEEV